MNRPRDQFLPAARFPINQNGGISGRHRFHLLQQAPQRGAPAHDFPEVHLAADFMRECLLLRKIERIHAQPLWIAIEQRNAHGHTVRFLSRTRSGTR